MIYMACIGAFLLGLLIGVAIGIYLITQISAQAEEIEETKKTD